MDRTAIIVASIILWAGAPQSGLAQPAAPQVTNAQGTPVQPAVPPPSWARSIEVVNDGAPVMMAPDPGSRRRGTVGRGARLGVERRVFGPGCSTGVWYETTDHLFVCEEHVRPSVERPGIDPVGTEAGQTKRHAFVRVDGTRAYTHPSDYFANDYVEAFGEGFGLVVTGSQVYEGVEFLRTRQHTWVDRGSVRFAKGSGFSGIVVGPGESLDFAWVSPRRARLYRTPGGRVLRALGRREVVEIESLRGRWAKLRSGGFVRRSDLAVPTPTDPPEGVGGGDRWIDVDVDQQILVAYQGETPMFATLVSSGRESPSFRTPKGVFPIWVKLARTDMDDIERTDVSKNYSIQDVPWVQFFERAYGFHAAFWHDDFGRRRSHGCVNLSPSDARYLFQFTEPALPPGWNAILPTPQDRPTLVQVR